VSSIFKWVKEIEKRGGFQQGRDAGPKRKEKGWGDRNPGRPVENFSRKQSRTRVPAGGVKLNPSSKKRQRKPSDSSASHLLLKGVKVGRLEINLPPRGFFKKVISLLSTKNKIKGG